MTFGIRAETQPDRVNGRSDPAGAPITLERLRHAFGALQVLDSIDLETGPGEVVGLVGPSGCGKSTLLELVAGLAEPAAGTISVGGALSAAERLRRCAYMPQRDLLFPWLTALDNAALAARNRGLSRGAARAVAEPMLERFGLADFAGAHPGELSGGMRQRIAFMRTLISDKSVLLLDEPFASLDAITRAEMQEWLAGALGEAPRTSLLVTHDVEEALYLCDRVMVLSARPARIMLELVPAEPRSSDRTAAVTGAELTAMREQALEALREGAR